MNETPTITRTRKIFAMTYAVEIDIRAAAEVIWGLLTHAADFPRWNSTVTRIEGEIREGQRLALRVAISDRTFRPTVSGVVANQRMRWSDGFAPLFKGVRTFNLSARGGGSTTFSMEERFSGLMLPLLRGSLPDLGPAFERYAMDLKREAEGARR